MNYVIKGIGGEVQPKKIGFVHFHIYVVALSFVFPKWGQITPNYQNFLFYKDLVKAVLQNILISIKICTFLYFGPVILAHPQILPLLDLGFTRRGP